MLVCDDRVMDRVGRVVTNVYKPGDDLRKPWVTTDFVTTNYTSSCGIR